MSIEIKSIWGKQVVDLADAYNRAVKEGDDATVLATAEELLNLAQSPDMKVNLRAAQVLEKIGHVNWQVIQSLAGKIVEAMESDSFLDKASKDTIIIALRWAYPEIDPRATSADILEFVKQKLSED